MAISFSHSHTYVINDDDISEIAALLCVDYKLLYKAINYCTNGVMPVEMIKIGEEYCNQKQIENADLFSAIVRMYFIYKNIDKISDDTSYDAILNNYNIFQSCIGEFDCINATIATFECMAHNFFTLEFNVFNSSDYQPKSQLNLLMSFLSYDQQDVFDRRYLPFLYRTISYEFITRVNSLYLITIVQIIKHSVFMDDKIKAIANEMYSYLLEIIQNARIISVQSNILSPLNQNNPAVRGKHENTTRLQILYSYENFDSYYLRLDLAHKGEGFIHYNNKSPGGIKCCLFTKAEYQSVVNSFPSSKNFFIEYSNRYALKELSNLNLTKEGLVLYEKIRAKKEHLQAFEDVYNENSVVNFINTISLMLPPSCRVPIDVEERHATYCFNYDKIMFYSVLLQIAFFSQNQAKFEKLLSFIASLACKYGLITEDMKSDFSCIEGVCFIIDEAKNRTIPYNNQQ